VSLSEAVLRALASSERPGVLVVVSDFLDASPHLDALRRARFEGHEVILVQILSRQDLDPGSSPDELDAELSLVDAETGEALNVLLDGATIAAYQARLEALFESLRRFARAAGATYVRAAADEPLTGVVRRVIRRGID
jgi:hypothetical protein